MSERRHTDAARERATGDGTGSATRQFTPGRTLIAFRCVRREHAEPTPRMTLTIHDGKWAFCRHEGATQTHEWVPVAGIALRDLMLVG